MKKYLFMLFTVLLLSVMSSVTASVTCNNQYLTVNYNQTDSTTKTIRCINGGNQTVTLEKIGDYFAINSNSLNSGEEKDLFITFDSNAPIGLHTGQINFSDNSQIINLFFNVNTKPLDNGGVIVFPTAKVINIQQGVEKQQNIQVIVPSTYTRTLTIQSVTQNPEIDLVKFSDMDLGQLHAGQTLNIPLTISGKDAQVGSYSTQINILATDQNGQVQLSPVNLQIVVSSSINPISGTNVSRPTCTLSASQIPLNTTAKLTCSNAVTNLDISPQYNEYIQGIDAVYSSGVYTYTFMPIKVGSTNLITSFKIVDSPVFAPDNQALTILPTGLVSNGNILKLDFFQNGARKSINNLNPGETSFLVLDNSSGSIVPKENYQVLLNGQTYTNSSINIELNKVYDLRITSLGYDTLTIYNLTSGIVPVNFEISPLKDLYKVGEWINFNSSIENVSYLVNNFQIQNPYSLSYAGNFTIQAVKEGYISTNKTINVDTISQINSCLPLEAEWKEGSDVTCDLTKSANWMVKLIQNGTNKDLGSGNGTKLQFKISEPGVIAIYTDYNLIKQVDIKNEGIFNWIKKHWIISTLSVIIVIIIILSLIRKKNTSNNLGSLTGN
jgi:hypothetical protein